MKAVTSIVEFDPDKHAAFSQEALETYAFARREAVVIDAITLIAAVEYADRTLKRGGVEWCRCIQMQVPVYALDRWIDPQVSEAMQAALNFLTGDHWEISFIRRKGDPPSKPQDSLPFSTNTDAILAFSEGLDSRAVAGLYEIEHPGRLLKVRVSNKKSKGVIKKGVRQAFTGMPYEVKLEGNGRESSGRSRGFKFAMIASVAAYLVNSNKVIVTESGQGVFGPVLLQNLQCYSDYRNHPFFLKRVERFVFALLNHKVHFEFPRLWSTKGETLRAYVSASGKNDWISTRSCWKDSRWSSVSKTRRQCGVCAACLLRRMSVFAAGLEESPDKYICESLGAVSLQYSAARDFKHLGKTFAEYAIAGVKQLDQFGDLANPLNTQTVEHHAVLLSYSLELPLENVREKLLNLIINHKREWEGFIESQGEKSFLRTWACGRN